MSKEEHESLLGMDVSTATARLKKAVMMDLIRKAGLDSCHRCGKTIEHPDDLSLDHIQPWRRVSADLFWDLSNVAFSHRGCNKVDRPGRKIGPEGTSWCSACKKFLELAEFASNQSKWNGISGTCKLCDRERIRRYDQRNPRFPCPTCKHPMRKTCSKCGYDLPMKDYMRLRRSENVRY